MKTLCQSENSGTLIIGQFLNDNHERIVKFIRQPLVINLLIPGLLILSLISLTIYTLCLSIRQCKKSRKNDNKMEVVNNAAPNNQNAQIDHIDFEYCTLKIDYDESILEENYENETEQSAEIDLVIEPSSDDYQQCMNNINNPEEFDPETHDPHIYSVCRHKDGLISYLQFDTVSPL